MNDIVILSIVFLAMFGFCFVFLSVIMEGKGGKEKGERKERAITRPMDRFVSPEELEKRRYGTAFICGIFFLVLFVLAEMYFAIPLAVVMGVLGYFCPLWYYQAKLKSWQKRFDEGMLDFVSLISTTIRGGMSLQTAMEMALPSVGGYVQEEFSKALQEHRLGKELPEVLVSMNQRVDSENLQLFLTVVAVNQQTGGSISGMLQNVAATMRGRNDFERKLKSLMAQGKFESLILSILPLAAFGIMFLIDSNRTKLLVTTKAGIFCCCIIAVQEVCGYLLTRYLTKVDY